MVVYCNCSFSNDLWDKNVYCAKFMDGMIYHFQNISFGEGAKEVTYCIVSGNSVFLLSFGAGITYGRKNKGIGSLFVIDYETLQSLEGETLLTYLSRQLIEETKKFENKKIKNFNLEAYIKSLEEYFAEAMQLMQVGKSPSEGKVLNENIELAIAKKWSKL